MEITILLKSSSQSEPRSVDVVQDDLGLSFFCDCPAGIRERICKHKMALATGNANMLYDENQRENYEKVMEWVAQSGYPNLIKELKEAENEMEPVRDKVRDIKVKIARVMKEGLK